MKFAGNCTLALRLRRRLIMPNEALRGPKGSPLGSPRLGKLTTLLPTLMNQPSPSGGELGRLTPIYRWLAFAGLRRAEQSFELFEFF